MKTNFSVELILLTNAPINEVLTEAVEIATRLGRSIETRISGVAMRIGPGLKPISAINSHKYASERGLANISVELESEK